jgi:multidrug efflux pump subunit AcrB
VNNIEHIESQSIANYGIIKIYFQPSVNINGALAQVTAMSQTVLKQMPAGTRRWPGARAMQAPERTWRSAPRIISTTARRVAYLCLA